MADPLLHVYPGPGALCDAAAEATVRLVAASPADAPFALVLSGGSTPRRYHERLATTYRDAVPWDRIHVFWGDERYVPPDHPDSNFGMARETLLRHVPLPPENVHPMPTGPAAPEAAADAYEAGLRRFFGGRPTAFDLVLLGLGDDGHTASLFPDTPVLDETSRWVAPGLAPPSAPSRTRLTLTFPILNQSRNVFFLVAGAAKHTPLRAILDDPDRAAARYPAARIRPAGALHWFVDTAAHDGPTNS